MAITKNSSKSESWTIRIPNNLANAVRQKFSLQTGNTQIVIEAIKQLLGIDSSLTNSVSNNDLMEVKLKLDEIRSRLSALEHQNISFNKSTTSSNKPDVIDQEWITIKELADFLEVKTKSITNNATEGIQLGKLRIFSIAGRTINKKGIGRKALYQLQ
jgi:predicted nuclease with TOPRIM domain